MKKLLFLSLIFILLNALNVFSATEDFTTWTNENTNCNHTISASRVEWTSGCSGNLRWNFPTYFGQDYGVGHFGDYDHDYTCSTNYSTGSRQLCWGIGDNSTGDFTSFETGNDGIAHWNTVDTPSSPDQYRLYLQNFIDDSTDYYTGTVPQYFTSKRISNVVTLELYSDSSRTTLVDTLAVSNSSTTFRYLYVGSMGGSSSSSGLASGYVENLDLNESVASTFKPKIIIY